MSALNESQFRYHVASPHYRSNIEKKGLDPKEAESGGIWAFGSKSLAAAHSDSAYGPGDVWEAPADTFEPGHLESKEWTPDSDVHVSHSRIPPNAIRRVSVENIPRKPVVRTPGVTFDDIKNEPGFSQ